MVMALDRSMDGGGPNTHLQFLAQNTLQLRLIYGPNERLFDILIHNLHSLGKASDWNFLVMNCRLVEMYLQCDYIWDMVTLATQLFNKLHHAG